MWTCNIFILFDNADEIIFWQSQEKSSMNEKYQQQRSWSLWKIYQWHFWILWYHFHLHYSVIYRTLYYILKKRFFLLQLCQENASDNLSRSQTRLLCIPKTSCKMMSSICFFGFFKPMNFMVCCRKTYNYCRFVSLWDFSFIKLQIVERYVLQEYTFLETT